MFPGAGYIAMAIAIGNYSKDKSANAETIVGDLTFKKAMIFENDKSSIKTQLSLQPAESKDAEGAPFTIFSADGSNVWQEHCTGKYAQIERKEEYENAKDLLKSIKDRCSDFISKDEIYRIFNEAGLEYGPNFQGKHIYCVAM